MKKVFKYLQNQALEASQQKYSGASYLSPTSKEPQQQTRHHNPSHYKDQHNSHHQSRSAHPSSAAHSLPAHTATGTSLPTANGKREMSSQLPDKIFRGITRHQYAQDNILQSYELYIPEHDQTHLADAKGNKYWVIYIHGGYFRDPYVSSSSFYPALGILASEKDHGHDPKDNGQQFQASDITPYIAGYATVNYRLSAHMQKAPQDPDTTPTYELRNAKWPEHIYDVLAAIAHLQNKYAFGERYLLVGHSVGATMGLLSVLAAEKAPFSTISGLEMPTIEPPMAILGVSGIYDFPRLHESVPDYVGLTRNAIHSEADVALASPAKYTERDYVHTWTGGGKKKRALVIAHSRDDGWVDWKQPEAMESVLKSQPAINVRVCEMKGQHNDIWEKGTELARVVVEAVGVMRGLEA
ncbi:hypothetical protein A1O7_07442 [Cladophialophora yegresii CBS 114405]|uniref:Kynurenine formamidase n=1 Tax=Cladophialophora yegresii CBS 114405 TaxID=1182544 RepID=W9VNJ0_9EURO|nr:uncharacterized protein A1O7_07442 [Cladophialophora yegresii CBS 114405]EXJ57098.1 hypothetical protein A1O7_07442 [Cladophialophora yegresii CBS 114405]